MVKNQTKPLSLMLILSFIKFYKCAKIGENAIEGG